MNNNNNTNSDLRFRAEYTRSDPSSVPVNTAKMSGQASTKTHSAFFIICVHICKSENTLQTPVEAFPNGTSIFTSAFEIQCLPQTSPVVVFLHEWPLKSGQ